MNKAPARVLVTGAGAFIGSHLCQVLAARGYEVHALTLDGKVLPFIQSGPPITVHTADIVDVAAITQVMRAVQPDMVFHLAAFGTLTRERAVESLIRVNILGTQNVLAAAAASGCRAFVQAGSAKVYAPNRRPILENEPLHPWDEYAATKAAAEFFCRLASERHNLSVTVLRLSPVYGPGEDESRFVPTAIRAAITGQPFTISVGPLVRNFTYVDDVVTAFIRAAERHGGFEVFNIGSSQVISFTDILREVQRASDRPFVLQDTRAQSASDDSWIVNVQKAQQKLQWQAHVSLAEGIQRTFDWYQRAGQERWSTKTSSSVPSDQTNAR